MKNLSIFLFILLFATLLPGCGDSAIQSSGITPTSTPHPNLNYQINDLIVVRNSQIIVKSLRYEDLDYTGSGIKKAIINFDIYTGIIEKETLRPEDFLYECIVKNGQASGLCAGKKITINQWNNVDVTFYVSKTATVTSVSVMDPVYGLGYKISVNFE